MSQYADQFSVRQNKDEGGLLLSTHAVAPRQARTDEEEGPFRMLQAALPHVLRPGRPMEVLDTSNGQTLEEGQAHTGECSEA